METILLRAVKIHNELMDIEAEIMHEVGGHTCLENFDQELFDKVMDLVCSATDAVTKLSPRAREARLNAIWRDFVREQQKARAERVRQGGGDGNCNS